MDDTQKHRIAECVGLWLAEGDNTSTRELTFTNNCFELIIFFHETIIPLYKGNNKPRLYIYSPTTRTLITKISEFKVKNYQDRRANRTYFIYRLADTKFMKIWRQLVLSTKNDKEYYADILRGIFAGEGNIKHFPNHNNSRNLRISIKQRDQFLENLLNHFEIKYTFDSEKRSYVVTGRSLSKLDKIAIATLHPEKEAKFRKMINSVKEQHYSPGELKDLLLKKLDIFYTTRELASIFKKSELRILETLQELRKENLIGHIRIKGKSCWSIKEKMDNYINYEKIAMLEEVQKYKTLTDIGKNIGVSRKVVRRRLLNYQKEGLLRNNEGTWEITSMGKTICGIDESGSE